MSFHIPRWWLERRGWRGVVGSVEGVMEAFERGTTPLLEAELVTDFHIAVRFALPTASVDVEREAEAFLPEGLRAAATQQQQSGKRKRRGGGGRPSPVVVDGDGGDAHQQEGDVGFSKSDRHAHHQSAAAVLRSLARVATADEFERKGGRVPPRQEGGALPRGTLARDVPQSPWVVDGERVGQSSVQTARSVQAVGVDVRMLGSGRPFVLELIGAKRVPSAAECKEGEGQIARGSDGRVRVSRLQVVGKQACEVLKEGEADKQKTYAAVVWCDRPVSDDDIKRMEETKELAGTYIKEFVHGDLGRTHPNLGSLLGGNVETDILQLDVTDIDLPFP
eukprot:jgi/Chlat1/1065/Chrsp110S01562